MVKTVKTSQIIGEGKYGCVLKPSLKCRKTKKSFHYKNKISKIMKTSESATEMVEYDIMKRIDPSHQYYLGYPTKCSPKKTEMAKKSVKKCEHFSEKKLDEYDLLVMEYGGLNIKQFAHWVDKQSSNNSSKKYQKIMKDFWLECRRMFDGVLLLKKNGVLHNDLKPQNIVYDMKKKRTNFIDFGLTLFSKDVRKMCEESKYYNDSLHWSYPPEIILTNKDKFNKITEGEKSHTQFSLREKEFKDFVKDVEDDQDGHINYFMEVTEKSFGYPLESETESPLLDMVKQHIEDFHTFLYKEIDEHSYDDFMNAFINTMDVYGLGVSLIYLLHRTADLIPETVAKQLNALFLRMLHFNVFQRIGPEEAKQEFETIIQGL